MIHRSSLQHNKGRDSQRKVTPPGPSYMSNDQIGESALLAQVLAFFMLLTPP